MNLVCLKHSKYRGEGSPVISCATCCGIYIDRLRKVKEEKAKSFSETSEWIEAKKQEALSSYVKKQNAPVFVPFQS